MATTLDSLYNWILANWSNKPSLLSGSVAPTTDPYLPFAFYVHLDALGAGLHDIYTWDGNAWSKGLGGGGLDEVDWSIIQNKPTSDAITQGTANLYMLESEKNRLAEITDGLYKNVGTNLSLNIADDGITIRSSTGDDVILPLVAGDNAGDLSGLMHPNDKDKLDALPTNTTLTNSLALKAPIASPTLTGTPTAPTALTADDSTQIATTAHVKLSAAALIATYDDALESSKLEGFRDDIGFLEDDKVDKTQIGEAEVGLVKGVASLDTGGKVPFNQLPDVLLGQLVFGGTAYFTSTTFSLSINGAAKLKLNSGVNYISGVQNVDISNTAIGGEVDIAGYEDCENVFFIVSEVGTYDDAGTTRTGASFAGKIFQVGDWLISTGTAWDKVDNTDAVTSVNGQIGAVSVASPDKTIVISVPIAEEIPLNLKVYEPFTITRLSHKLIAGTCKFYFKRIREATTTYLYEEGGEIIYSSSIPDNVTRMMFSATPALVSTDGGPSFSLIADDYFSIVIVSPDSASKMLAITLDT